MRPSRLVRADEEVTVQGSETTRVPFPHPSASESDPPDVLVDSVEPENTAQAMSTRCITFKRPPHHWTVLKFRNVPGLTMIKISGLSSFYHRDLEKVSEILKDGKDVFSGTGNAWHVGQCMACDQNQNRHGKVDAKYDVPSQKDVDNLLVTVSFSLDEETIHVMCSNPDPETVQTTCRSERVDDDS